MAKKSEFTLKRKLTVKEVCGDPKALFKAAEKADPKWKRLDLMKIAGVVTRLENVPTQYGESTRMIGDFIAVNLDSGEMFRSNRCFLPDVISETVEASLMQLKSGDPNATIEFAYQLLMIPDTNITAGYVYVAEPFVEAAESDRLGKLMETMGVKQLPAPESGKKK